MKYYKDQAGTVFAYAADGSQDHLIGGKTPITLEEADELRAGAQERFLRAQGGYSALRANAYPSIGDQLDDLFKAGVFSPEMAAKIAAVKNKYPK